MFMTIPIETLLHSLDWRYATKKFDTRKKLSEEQLNLVKEALRKSPSSFGVQPWKFIIVNNQDLKNTLRSHAWNQTQISDASHIVVLCTPKKMTEDHIKKYISKVASIRDVPLENLKGYETSILQGIKNKSESELDSWMRSQVYIALGMLIANCATAGIDTCPMEGFSNEKFDEILKLDDLGLKSVVLCAVGFRDDSDKYAKLPKVRFDKKDLFIRRD